MDFVRSYFCKNLRKKVRTKEFNWSEVHLYRSNFLQNPYFSIYITLSIDFAELPINMIGSNYMVATIRHIGL